MIEKRSLAFSRYSRNFSFPDGCLLDNDRDFSPPGSRFFEQWGGRLYYLESHISLLIQFSLLCYSKKYLIE
jgi:hypothetical protein